MKNYQVITITPQGVVEMFYQKARTMNLAVLMVKGAHHPGQPVKAEAREV